VATAATAGALSVLNSRGHVVETISGGAITGPWDLTAVDEGNHTVLFVTNVLNGTVMANRHSVDGGTVVRIVLRTDAVCSKPCPWRLAAGYALRSAAAGSVDGDGRVADLDDGAADEAGGDDLLERLRQLVHGDGAPEVVEVRRSQVCSQAVPDAGAQVEGRPRDVRAQKRDGAVHERQDADVQIAAA